MRDLPHDRTSLGAALIDTSDEAATSPAGGRRPVKGECDLRW
jgi:hypothetical protein